MKKTIADRIRQLDALAQDRLTTRQQAAALAAAIIYFADECGKKHVVTKENIFFCLETALQWADGNSMR